MKNKPALISFFGSQELKDKYVTRVKEHALADEIIKGTYWAGGKGCAVGCTVHSSNHLAYETEIGIPFDIALWEDRIFENLPNAEAKTFPLEFIEAIPVGKDLTKLGLKLSLFLLENETDGALLKVTGEDKKFLVKLQTILNKEIADTATNEDRGEFKAYAYAYAFASASASAFASAFASASAFAYAFASAYAYASAYASASAFARLRTILINLLKSA